MHIDEWIDRVDDVPEEENYPTFFFMLYRLNEVLKERWRPIIEKYKLFCTYKNKRYRVTGCSRLGDVWLDNNFNATHGYKHRVDVLECSNWSDKP